MALSREERIARKVRTVQVGVPDEVRKAQVDAERNVPGLVRELQVVRGAVPRRVVWEVLARIEEGLEKVRQGGEERAREFCVEMVGMMEEKSDFVPAYARVMAAAAIGDAERLSGLRMEKGGDLAGRVVEAIRDEGRITRFGQAALAAALRFRADPESVESEVERWRGDWPPSNATEDLLRYEHEGVMSLTAQAFAQMERQRQWGAMRFAAWVLSTSLAQGARGVETQKTGIPDRIVRMGPRVRKFSGGGELAVEMQVPTPTTARLVDAVVFGGVPAKGRYNLVERLERRNPSAVMTINTQEPDWGGLSWRHYRTGVGMPGMEMLEEGVMERFGGAPLGMREEDVWENLKLGGVAYFGGVWVGRMLRRQREGEEEVTVSRGEIEAAVGRVMRKLGREFDVWRREGGEEVRERRTSVLASYQEELAESRRVLGQSIPDGSAMNESLKMQMRALVAEPVGEGKARVREEMETALLARDVFVWAGLPEKDRPVFMVSRDSLRVKPTTETIRRRMTDLPPLIGASGMGEDKRE